MVHFTQCVNIGQARFVDGMLFLINESQPVAFKLVRVDFMTDSGVFKAKKLVVFFEQEIPELELEFLINLEIVLEKKGFLGVGCYTQCVYEEVDELIDIE
jgi:hypothetical protein